MVDYNKKTVAELKEILESRSLAATGKKADLVAKLQEADKEAETNAETKAPTAEATATSKPAPVPVPTAKPAETSAAAATITEPVEAAGGAADAAAATTAQDGASPSANTDTQLAATTNYALGLQASSVDDEMAKRKARAARFGTGVATEPTTTDGENATSTTETNNAGAGQDEATKALERAKRFGVTSTTAMGKLDEALPTERERGSRKRGRPTNDGDTAGGGDVSMDDPGLLRKGGGFRGGRGGRRGGRQGSRGPRGERPEGVQKSTGAVAYTSDRDRLAAEARKKRFAAAG